MGVVGVPVGLENPCYGHPLGDEGLVLHAGRWGAGWGEGRARAARGRNRFWCWGSLGQGILNPGPLRTMSDTPLADPLEMQAIVHISLRVEGKRSLTIEREVVWLKMLKGLARGWESTYAPSGRRHYLGWGVSGHTEYCSGLK